MFLVFKRDIDACYGDTWRADYWQLKIDVDGVQEEFYTERVHNTITEDIYRMFDDILDFENWWELYE